MEIEFGETEYLLADRGYPSRRCRVLGSWGLDGLYIIMLLDEKTGKPLPGTHLFEGVYVNRKKQSELVEAHITVDFYDRLLCKWTDRGLVLQKEAAVLRERAERTARLAEGE